MNEPVTFTVFGEAQPAGSKRRVPIRVKDAGGHWVETGKHRIIDANPEAEKWKNRIAFEAGRIMTGRALLETAILLQVVFYRPRPKGHYGTGKNEGRLKPSATMFPTTKPDTTKLVRGVEDALTGIIWRDDAQVCRQVAEKLFGEPARVEIRISELEARSIKREGSLGLFAMEGK